MLYIHDEINAHVQEFYILIIFKFSQRVYRIGLSNIRWFSTHYIVHLYLQYVYIHSNVNTSYTFLLFENKLRLNNVVVPQLHPQYHVICLYNLCCRYHVHLSRYTLILRYLFITCKLCELKRNSGGNFCKRHLCAWLIGRNASFWLHEITCCFVYWLPFILQLCAL